MVSLMIVGLIVGVTVPQLAGLYKTNSKNSNTLTANTTGVNELEAVKELWTTTSSGVPTAWHAGTYTPTSSKVTFSCATWSNLSTAPLASSFSSTCVTTTSSTARLKRIKLVITGTNTTTQTVYLDIARP